jgi:hypothetical protein
MIDRYSRKTPMGPRIFCGWVTLFVLVLSVTTEQQALAQKGSLELDGGKIHYSFYAPEWIWQRQNINILTVFESELPTTATVRATLGYPPYHADRFSYDGPTSSVLILGPGQSGRLAFANILALDKRQLPNGEFERFRTGDFVFQVDLQCEADGKTASVLLHYPVKTVRGAIVNEGLLSTWLPVVLILLWCGLIFLIVPRMARRGAWRQSSDPIDEKPAE